ncbi:MAG: HugZ family protein [Solirubrobacterales bacterium]
MTPANQNDHGQLPANNRHALRLVARACRKGALGTLMDGAPYVSLVTVAFDHDLAPILLLSGLSDHTRNLAADPRVSLLLDGTDGLDNPQTGPRVTLIGEARPTTDAALVARFLARHPSAAQYASFADFSFWRIAPARAHFVGGFGRAVWFDYPFGIEPAESAAFRQAEPDLLGRCGGAVPGATVVAIDADGCDLTLGDGMKRVAFPTPLHDPEGAETALAAVLDRVTR